jgi:hypothetical protein
LVAQRWDFDGELTTRFPERECGQEHGTEDVFQEAQVQAR